MTPTLRRIYLQTQSLGVAVYAAIGNRLAWLNSLFQQDDILTFLMLVDFPWNEISFNNPISRP